MPKWKSHLWTLIRKESAPEKIDWAAVSTLVLYSLLVVLLLISYVVAAWMWFR